MVVIRIWGLLKPSCLPVYTATSDTQDSMSLLFRLLTKLWICCEPPLPPSHPAPPQALAGAPSPSPAPSAQRRLKHQPPASRPRAGFCRPRTQASAFSERVASCFRGEG